MGKITGSIGTSEIALHAMRSLKKAALQMRTCFLNMLFLMITSLVLKFGG